MDVKKNLVDNFCLIGLFVGLDLIQQILTSPSPGNSHFVWLHHDVQFLEREKTESLPMRTFDLQS